MRRMCLVLGVVLLLGADDAKKDQEKIQGTWVLQSAERGGKPVDLDKDQKIPRTFTFKGDKFTMGDDRPAWTFKLGHAGKLGTIDLVPEEARGKDHQLQGVYSVEGDTLKMCVDEAKRSERPTELASKEGTEQVVGTFVRKK